MKRILFYDDTTVFGGHQVMTLAAIRYLLSRAGWEVIYAYCKTNQRLDRALHEMASTVGEARFRIESLPFQASRRDALFAPFSWIRGWKLLSLIRRVSPTAMVVVQGGVNVCAIGLFWGRVSGVRTVSYLPMDHQPTGSILRDVIRKIVYGFQYRLPNKILTVSQPIGDRLLSYGARKVSIIPNGIDICRYHRHNRNDARMELGLPADDYILAIVGRVLFEQKGHDLLIEAFPRIRTPGRARLLVVGDGPDIDRLKSMVARKGLDNRVSFLAWAENLSMVYSAVDLLVIPSRFEGFPVVMLEAMYFGLPVVAAQTDGLREALPTEWLFPIGDVDALVETASLTSNSNNDEALDRHRLLVGSDYTLEKFGLRFSEALDMVAKTE